MPTCGNCQRHHDTVQQVKDCYGSSSPVHAAVLAATVPQMNYIADLLTELGRSPLPEGTKLGKTEASHLIGELKEDRARARRADPGRQSADGDPEGYGDPRIDYDAASQGGPVFGGRQLPRPKRPLSMEHPASAFRTSPQAAEWGIPAGYYAIKGANGRDLDFFRVKRPDKGRWLGYTFVNMVVGGKADMPVRGKQRLFEILFAIHQDQERAAWLYGTNIGQCDKCNRHLTDKVSRDHGRGPDCRAKYGPGHLAAYAAA